MMRLRKFATEVLEVLQNDDILLALDQASATSGYAIFKNGKLVAQDGAMIIDTDCLKTPELRGSVNIKYLYQDVIGEIEKSSSRGTR